MGGLRCDTCGSAYWANSAPTASALVEDAGGRLLLGRRAVEPWLGMWDPLGGFLHEGEDPVQGLVRELREETGLELEPLGYLGCWVGWYGETADAVATFNLFWRARFVAGEPKAADDVSELRWFAPDALPPAAEVAFDLWAEVVAAWRQAKGEAR